MWKDILAGFLEGVAKGLEKGTRPQRSSAFQQTMEAQQRIVQNAVTQFQAGQIGQSDLASVCMAVASAVREIGDECSAKRDNMPDSLQDSPTGELLESRQSDCDDIANGLATAASRIRNMNLNSRPQIAAIVAGVAWNYS